MAMARRMLPLLLILPILAIRAAEVGGDIRDAAARIDYGFYTEDPNLIVAAGDAFTDRSNDPWASYLRAYASYREALVMRMHQRPASGSLSDCIGSAEVAADSEEAEVEAFVLIAACSAVAATNEPARAVLHQRRYRRAISRVVALDPENPRLLLIAMQSGRAADGLSSPAPGTVLDAFRSRAEPFAFPDWGEAEALATLGAIQLETGDRRGARDLIEAALLSAPDYRYALKLAARISNLAATN